MIQRLEQFADAIDDSFARRARWTEILRAEPEPMGEQMAVDLEAAFAEN